jgi:hypothetical protein
MDTLDKSFTTIVKLKEELIKVKNININIFINLK